MLDTRLVTWALSLWTAITFVVCVVYVLVTPQSLGMQQFLEMILPAFKWLTWWGFLLGLVESFLYGAYAGLVFCPIYNMLHRRWGCMQILTREEYSSPIYLVMSMFDRAVSRPTRDGAIRLLYTAHRWHTLSLAQPHGCTHADRRMV